MSQAPDQPCRVLLIEDSRADAELVSIALRDGGLRADCTQVWSADSVRQALRDSVPQLVLSDLNLPGFSAEEALELVRAHDPALPFVLLTGAPLTGLSDPPLDADATLSKDELEKLPTLIRSLLPHSC